MYCIVGFKDMSDHIKPLFITIKLFNPCGAMAEACFNRRWAYAVVISLLVFAMLHSYIRIISTIVYTYLYWLNPSLEYVSESHGVEELPVPKLLHQTWVDKNVPERWKKAQESCIKAHPDYTYKLWTDEEGLELIRNEYPWFLDTYEKYPYNIQRVDAVRYFILHKYGGIYIDLDMGCNRELKFLRQANFTAPLTYPVGISNDVMAAVPGNRYLERAIHRLQYWNHWLFIKYIQVMFSTGPMFLTSQYATARRGVKKAVSVIPATLYGKYDFSGDPAFYHLHGSSWHADDAAFIFILDAYKYHLIVFACAFAILGLVLRYRLKKQAGTLPVSALDKMP